MATTEKKKKKKKKHFFKTFIKISSETAIKANFPFSHYRPMETF